MGRKNDDGWKNLNQPPRKQDPYVTGRRDSYVNGGEVQPGSSGGGQGDNNEGCGKDSAAMVIAFVAMAYMLRGFVRGRR
jgi:hypothetical protein